MSKDNKTKNDKTIPEVKSFIVRPTKEVFSTTVFKTKDGTKMLGKELILKEDDSYAMQYVMPYVETLEKLKIVTVEVKNG